MDKKTLKKVIGWLSLITLLILDRYFLLFEDKLPDNWYAVIFSVLVGLDDKFRDIFNKK